MVVAYFTMTKIEVTMSKVILLLALFFATNINGIFFSLLFCFFLHLLKGQYVAVSEYYEIGCSPQYMTSSTFFAADTCFSFDGIYFTYEA